ncbi:hypothetical protein ACIO3O_37200 [Streptomyces sp. NPDC087440]|uniref:hypothetical protein n=1 Tax=Streptomyces sp. NPDC087440 TaxID=3365790 RepID=UPI0037FE4043
MTPENLARITAARAARDISDLARQAVAAAAADMPPEERLQAVRRLRQLANELVDVTVLAEALAGTPWTDTAHALGRQDPDTVEAEYEESVAEWRALPPEALSAAAAGTEGLDHWYARHREDHDPDVETPVSDLLNSL